MKKKVLSDVFSYIKIVILALLLALNYIIFITNNKFAPSGINGIATMIQYKFGFSIGYFSLIINVPLSIWAYFKISKGFAIKSFVFTVVYSIGYLLFQKIDFSRFAYNANGVDVILPVIAAAIITGFVYGQCFSVDASTGGTDIIAKLISKKRPDFNFITIILIMNVMVAFASYFVYVDTNELGQNVYNFKPVILCILYSFINSAVSNYLLNRSRGAVKFEIISDYGEEIAKELIDNLHHSVSLNKVIGKYSNSEKDHLVCIVNTHQIHDIRLILEKYPNTFTYVTSLSNVLGNFKHIK